MWLPSSFRWRRPPSFPMTSPGRSFLMYGTWFWPIIRRKPYFFFRKASS